MGKIIFLFRALLLFFLPSWMLRLLAPVLGIELMKGARIGFSIVLIEKLKMKENARIGHFNFVKLRQVQLEPGAYIGKLNRISGATLDIYLHGDGAIGDSITIYRANPPVTYGIATLEIGVASKITFRHYIDCTRSIRFGNYSTLAGVGCQIWTHGYFHAEQGIERVRIDGEVNIGNNVNISSACVINPGVTIADGVTVGSHVCVSSSLLKKGMYVSQGLRFIPKDINDIRSNYEKIQNYTLVDEVYERK